ncbi:hypothetical protein [Amycolatopsis sp. NPDC003731]
MTTPDPTNTIILQFIREELGTVRTSMHEELTGLRADISGLSDKLGGHITDTASRVSVLEHQHRVQAAEISEMRADDRAERAASNADEKAALAVRRANYTFALSTLIAVAGVVVPIFAK